MVSIGSPCNCLKDAIDILTESIPFAISMINTTSRSTVILMSLVTMRLPGSTPSLTPTSRHCFRDSCKWEDGHCLKDLRLLAIDMAKVFIIDNTPRVFRLHVNNGIPIKSWYWDCRDHALRNLLPFLEKLVDVDDVRPIIAARFWKRVKSAPPSAAHIRRKFLLRNSF
ncbi:uncharacterized protein LOC108321938 isoform X2 [Vigna angularis]|uniref:uncharacterized protein LOC108321938 isoform X2 n=1 Tax=Phaseolus angularis TaxID=3914 RepID=UPI0022B346DA|nr:uncharacterized protein LOC108321938 isoform X2 [Vigna angularis]